jgi:hypothetical protein
VFVPGAAAIGMGMVLAAPIGRKLAHFLPAALLPKFFAAFLLVAAAGILFTQLPVQGLLAGGRDFVADLLFAPLCDPTPAPAAPAFETEALHGGQQMAH